MKKLITVVAASVCAVSFSAAAFADASASDDKANADAMEEEEDQIFEAGLDVDLFSAYIWRSVVQTDKPVLQPCVWADLTYFDPFYFGFSYWQGWDLSSDRKDTYKRRLNESDYNIHAGVTAWENEDMSLEFEGGHEWYTYHFDNGVPSTRELYLKGKFANPVVDVYGQVSWLYDDNNSAGIDSGFYYEIGFNREFELCDELTFGLDWNTSMADSDYNAFMTGVGEAGFLGTTLKAYLSWAVTDWMSIVGTIAYSGLLDSDVRHECNEGVNTWIPREDKDILWGGISAKFAF